MGMRDECVLITLGEAPNAFGFLNIVHINCLLTWYQSVAPEADPLIIGHFVGAWLFLPIRVGGRGVGEMALYG